VSHDRRFVDNVVTSTLVWEGDVTPGLWREYEGNVEDWQAQRARVRANAPAPVTPAPAPAPAPAAAPVAAPARPKGKLSYKEQRELDELPGRIEALEAEHKTLETALASNELYAQGREKIAATQARFTEVDELLLAAMERWEELGSR